MRGGALVVSFSLRAIPSLAQEQEQAASKPPLPGSLKKAPMLDAWIRIDADGSVTVFTGKAELGQGIKTALIQVAAEELELEPHAIHLVTADTARTPNEGYTAGSHSMKDSGTRDPQRRGAGAGNPDRHRGGAAWCRRPIGCARSRARSYGPMTAALAYGDLVAGDVLHVTRTADIEAERPADTLKSSASRCRASTSRPR